MGSVLGFFFRNSILFVAWNFPKNFMERELSGGFPPTRNLNVFARISSNRQ